MPILSILLSIILIAVCVPFLGMYLAQLFIGKPTFLHPLLGWLEKLTYEVTGVNSNEEMSWKKYAKTLLIFNFLATLLIFGILVTQQWLPFNPQNFPNVPWLLALNTAISFSTNTNWQAYAGETTMSYASQMWGMTVQNFLSAAIGCTVLMALIRGLTRSVSDTLGNFWADLVRVIIFLFLPLSFLFALLLISQGVIQTLNPYMIIETLEGGTQTIALGPVASQIAIKQLGTNGGGFFNANSAHPFENPTGLTNFFENIAMIIIPAASVYAYGLMIKSRKHGLLLLAVMSGIFLVGITISVLAEWQHNPVLEAYPVWEGKETRFGNANSAYWAITTAATGTGAVNAMMSSLSPLTSGIAMLNMMKGSIFGSVGVGLCSMLMIVILTIFLSGLMVGRSPEYLGKKIEKTDIQWVMLAILLPSSVILIGFSVACLWPEALAALNSAGPHRLSALLYTFTSATANNGSAFASVNANIDFYNVALSAAMAIGRIAIMLPSLALAGSLVTKKIIPPSSGTMEVNSPIFAIMLIGIVILVSVLTFFPMLSLGPIAEYLLILKSQGF